MRGRSTVLEEQGPICSMRGNGEPHVVVVVAAGLVSTPHSPQSASSAHNVPHLPRVEGLPTPPGARRRPWPFRIAEGHQALTQWLTLAALRHSTPLVYSLNPFSLSIPTLPSSRLPSLSKPQCSSNGRRRETADADSPGDVQGSPPW